MKKLFSARYSAGAVNGGMLLLRLTLGIIMIKIGYDKLVGFSAMKTQFMSFLGMGSTVSLSLVIFAEFFCSAFLILGLATRLATIPLIITMSVAFFVAHKAAIYPDMTASCPCATSGMTALLFGLGYLVILIIGPGKASVDGMISK